MATNQTTNELIAAILQLPIAEQARIYEAVHESLIDDSKDFGPTESDDKVESAWSDEIARRLEDIDSGRVKTVPADDAEKMIRGDVRPNV